MKHLLNLTAIAVTCVLGFAGTASAQLITWEPSVNLFQGETVQDFVNIAGDGLVAYNATALLDGTQDTTVNGVAFTSSGTDTTLVGVDGHSITLNGGSDNTGAFGDGEFANDVDIFNLIRGATFEVESVTLGGLVVGTDYSIQVFTNDARASRNVGFVTGLGDGSGTDAPVATSNLNNSPVNDDLGPVAPVFPETEAGDSITGTFTADATTLTFNVFGSTNGGETFSALIGTAQINAVQLRDVTNVGEDPDVLKGDVDLDGAVTFFDIAPFIEQLADGGDQPEADVDCDGAVTFFDIAPFIDILAGG